VARWRLPRGEDKGKDWVEKTLGWSVDLVERARKPAPKEVLMAWAREWAKEGLVLDWEKQLPPKGFLRCCRGGGWWSGHFLGSTREQEDEQRLREVARE
jgi:hypothetical protein